NSSPSHDNCLEVIRLHYRPRSNSEIMGHNKTDSTAEVKRIRYQTRSSTVPSKSNRSCEHQV
ncbi:hypothetical protein PENTCL1PPCAC_16075, partial [Pristionchus entomophagus]